MVQETECLSEHIITGFAVQQKILLDGKYVCIGLLKLQEAECLCTAVQKSCLLHGYREKLNTILFHDSFANGVLWFLRCENNRPIKIRRISADQKAMEWKDPIIFGGRIN